MRPRFHPHKALAPAFFSISLVLVPLNTPVLAADEGRPNERTQIEASAVGVQQVLDQRLRTSVFDWVEATVEGNRVILSGAVSLPATVTRIEKQMLRVPGITEVVREVETLPVSSFDDRLRRQAYREIYGNLTFSQFPALGRFPIHILVERGHITLVGTVASKVEARLAEARVRTATLAFGVDNQLRVGGSSQPTHTAAATRI